MPWFLALRPLRRILWAAGGENPPPMFSWSRISTVLCFLKMASWYSPFLPFTQPVPVSCLKAPSLARPRGLQPRLSTRHCSSVLPKAYLCPTAATVPPFCVLPSPAPPLFLSAEKT